MSDREQTIALAGVFQALGIVYSIAHKGFVDMSYYEKSVQSVFILDADSTLAVFGNDFNNLKLGFKQLSDCFSSPNGSSKSMEITRYFLNIMVLEKRLSNNPEILDKIKLGIERAESQLEHFSADDEHIASMLAQTYKQTVSTINPKIMVSGESIHLNNSHHADKIRTMLLAAVRSTVLWRQRGGQRWRLVFDKNKISKTANELSS